jgi:hypothetical protein
VKLIVAAFWCRDEDSDEALDRVTREPIPGIKGSGSAVSFTQTVAADEELRRTLRRLNLTEAADFYPEEAE